MKYNIVDNHVNTETNVNIFFSDVIHQHFETPDFVDETTSFTPLLNDLYAIDTSTDSKFLTEFPALKAQLDFVQDQKGKTLAQKEALKTLRQKLRYPKDDPQPNIFQDTRSELEKVQSILRTTSQILDKDNLQIWNEACERNLHI